MATTTSERFDAASEVYDTTIAIHKDRTKSSFKRIRGFANLPVPTPTSRTLGHDKIVQELFLSTINACGVAKRSQTICIKSELQDDNRRTCCMATRPITLYWLKESWAQDIGSINPCQIYCCVEIEAGYASNGWRYAQLERLTYCIPGTQPTIAAAVAYALVSFFSGSEWIQLVIGGALFLATYLITAPIIGAVNQTDVNKLLSID